MIKKTGLAVSMFFVSVLVFSQDGFGFADDKAAGSGLPLALKISGEARAQLLGYGSDFKSPSKLELGNIFKGRLNFEAKSSPADAVINLKIEPKLDAGEWTNPFSLDEAYARFYLGDFNFEGGIRKLSWGKADSLGPLDVINPMDYSDLSEMSDLLAIKIARPMLHLSYNAGSFTKIEGVFIPLFQGNKYANQGRWMPQQFTEIPEAIADLYPSSMQAAISQLVQGAMGGEDISKYYPSTNTVNYSQAGLRFTTTIGSSDIGFQYYYGRLPKPSVTVEGLVPLPVTAADFSSVMPLIKYNQYHQVGIDYAQVIKGFNVRTELAANMTDDWAGSNGAVYNPSIWWSFGFDHDLFLGINLNMQATEAIILMHDKIKSNPAFDTEAGTKITFTRITTVLSKKILRDELEFKAKIIWDIEDMDCYIMPGISWTRGEIEAALSAGIFAGSHQGELGQYYNNYYIKTMMLYKF
ncbi:MAG: hypothetical protein LBV68_07450 [Spirochaetaceae bacterium]|jgi:hypothetical protein|nr:hypothetical protein [Spirochaetaceae bacterium]